MSNNISQKSVERRKQLSGLVSLMFLIAIAVVLYVFISSLGGSDKGGTDNQWLEIDTRYFAVGTTVSAAWQGKQLYISRRSAEQLALLRALSAVPGLYEQNLLERDADDHSGDLPDEFIVLTANRTGCLVKRRAEAPDYLSPEHWLGGFYSPCEDAYFNLSGRRYAKPVRVGEQITELSGLTVVPHTLTSDLTLMVGSAEPRQPK
ncbi:hypothetical protein BOW53_09235 [Solemya pervernicosa gill symbiont]|uniref:Uncharacterized protein n=2 Tax=Gammaproteobacteria incertae sedis TaxID=118884 RepID=A0A1T2L4P5_9GAMM|nr:hypothetical protein [Candidatus Reidiella endopervernicosa]OOZ40010.1 hypothetical protein BOW53_09235 [Solemya pervernicosa gill symbiont]QKQ25293.1 hypothetical protein HUE57_02545 [Candidatus Reidiella endopervernicosa]